MNKFINVSFIACIFLPLSQISLSFIDLYYYYVFVVVLFPILFFRYRSFDSGQFLVFTYLFIVGIVNLVMGNNDLFSFLKVFLGTAIFFSFYYYIIKSKNFNIISLLALYFKGSVATAIIGFVQFFSFLAGFKIGYELSWLGLRVIAPGELGGNMLYPIHSITAEPAAFAFLLAPAVYISLYRFTKSELPFTVKKWQSSVILASYILSQSSTGFFALFVAFILINLHKINFKRVTLALTTLISLFSLIYSASTKFQERLDSLINLITGEIVADAVRGTEAHGSSLILFNHFLIAKKNAAAHPLGTGLGSHHAAFRRHNTLKAWFTGFGPGSMELNIHDANSLFNRILSEMGYVGILFTFIFLISYFIRTGPPDLILLNHSSLVAILTALLRQGHYFILGLPFFILCYYYSAKFHAENKQNIIKIIPRF